MIHVSDFHKAYDHTIAVEGLNFEVAPGQILGLVGPNGAGKTTTLRAIHGVLPASRGHIEVNGKRVDESPLETKASLGFIPDDPQLFADLTVRQHLAFVASAYRVQDVSSKTLRLLDQFELTSKVDARAGDLSRGMRQKLAICCAYLHDPTAILFDEPLTGLDPRGIRTLKQSMLQRARDGAAVIVSSHLLAMVEDICSHVLILKLGSQKFFGPIDQLRLTFADKSDGATLEDIFFRATEESATAEHSIDATPIESPEPVTIS